jgi:hypothetical protein
MAFMASGRFFKHAAPLGVEARMPRQRERTSVRMERNFMVLGSNQMMLVMKLWILEYNVRIERREWELRCV